MRFFLDTEFNQNVDPVELISIGIVAEDGREFYAIFEEYDVAKCDEWIKENVLKNLIVDSVFGSEINKTRGMGPMIGNRVGIRTAVERFVGDDQTIQFWGYYADYDWYLFTRLWGFMHMPKNFPHLCYDIKQLQMHLGVPKLPEKLLPEHNALVDARWNKLAFDYLWALKK